MVMSIRNRPGALMDLLLPFSKAGIDLTRIESRPSQRKAWEYVFFLDLIGHVDDPNVAETLEQVQDVCVELKVLGSYPQGDIEI